jgi:flagellar hook-basal body complex protein FliE
MAFPDKQADSPTYCPSAIKRKPTITSNSPSQLDKYMDLKIPAINPAQLGNQLTKVGSAGTRPWPAASVRPQNALQSVSAAQNHSSQLQREVQLENPAVSLEQTMVAMQKSQIGFQATLHVRNRLVQAYSDVMNMQV